MSKLTLLVATIAFVIGSAAMADQEIRDPYNRLLGKIRQVGAKFEARDAQNRPKGTYDPRDNTTRNSNNRAVGKGNLLAALILRR